MYLSTTFVETNESLTRQRHPGADLCMRFQDWNRLAPEARKDVMEWRQEYLPPELLSRLDITLVFNTLSRESILAIVSLCLDVAHRLKNQRISLDMDGVSKDWLAQHGYSEIYDARAIASVVRTDVLFPLERKLLRWTIRYVSLSLLLQTFWWSFLLLHIGTAMWWKSGWQNMGRFWRSRRTIPPIHLLGDRILKLAMRRTHLLILRRVQCNTLPRHTRSNFSNLQILCQLFPLIFWYNEPECSEVRNSKTWDLTERCKNE